MAKIRSRFALLVARRAGALAPGAPAAQPLKKVTVVYTIVSGDSVAFWVAQEKGFFHKYGLDADLKFIPGRNQTIAAMMAGQVDFTNAGGGAVVEADLQGGDAVMIGSLVPYFLMSMYSQPEVQSVKGDRK